MAGNSSSRAAAMGTWPMRSVQPLSAPIDDRITAMEIAVAPHGPQSIWAASEKGATDFTSCSRGTIPMTAMVPST